MGEGYSLEGHLAVVTGGLQGIGRAIADASSMITGQVLQVGSGQLI